MGILKSEPTVGPAMSRSAFLDVAHALPDRRGRFRARREDPDRPRFMNNAPRYSYRTNSSMITII